MLGFHTPLSCWPREGLMATTSHTGTTDSGGTCPGSSSTEGTVSTEHAAGITKCVRPRSLHSHVTLHSPPHTSHPSSISSSTRASWLHTHLTSHNLCLSHCEHALYILIKPHLCSTLHEYFLHAWRTHTRTQTHNSGNHVSPTQWVSDTPTAL